MLGRVTLFEMWRGEEECEGCGAPFDRYVEIIPAWTPRIDMEVWRRELLGIVKECGDKTRLHAV